MFVRERAVVIVLRRTLYAVFIPSLPKRREARRDMSRVLLVFGLVVSPAAPLAVSFAPGLLGPAASAGPLLRRLRAVGVTHLAAVPQSDATVEHCADMYAVPQLCRTCGLRVPVSYPSHRTYLRHRAALRARCLGHAVRTAHSVAPQVEQELLESGALDGIISLSPTGEPDLDPELGSALDRKEWVHICGDISDLAGAKRLPDPLIPPLTIALALAIAIAIAIVLALTLALTLAFTLLPNPSPSLAGAKRVGGRTVWLNLQALS